MEQQKENFEISDFYNFDNVKKLIESPHILGHFLGKEKLKPIHSDWIRYCWDSNEFRALQAFRGGYKTTAIDIVGIIRWFLIRPNDRIAIIRKNYKDACSVVSTIKSLMEKPEVKRLFNFVLGDFVPIVAREGQLRYSFKKYVTPEANLTALGLDSSLTGYHFDKIICDDIITIKDRISKAERERTKEIIREIATNIIEPSKGSMWIGTPWHRDDGWREINTFTSIAQYPISEYNFLGDEVIEQKKRTTSPFLYALNYELKIEKDESLLFQEPQYISHWNFANKSICHIDAGYDGEDYCALSFIAPIDNTDIKKATKFQVAGFSYAGNVKDWLTVICKKYREFRATKILMETNADKGFLADKLKSLGLKTETYSEKQNKHIKISVYLYEYWRKIFFTPETDDEYVQQIIDYKENCGFDDCPDSLASLIRQVFYSKEDKYQSLYEW